MYASWSLEHQKSAYLCLKPLLSGLYIFTFHWCISAFILFEFDNIFLSTAYQLACLSGTKRVCTIHFASAMLLSL